LGEGKFKCRFIGYVLYIRIEQPKMNEEICLLDTDILSYLLKQMQPAYNRACQHLAQTGVLTISCMTYYECIRGYQAIGASKKKLGVFYELMPCNRSDP
jgi:hypothetical protein